MAAPAEVEAILDSGCVAHGHFFFARAAIDQVLERGDWDRPEGYAARLERYARSEQLPWSDYLIARGRAAAAWGRGTRSSELTAQLDRVPLTLLQRSESPLSADCVEKLQPEVGAALLVKQ